MADGLKQSARGFTDAHVMSLIPLTTSQDPRPLRSSRSRQSLSQIRYDQSHHDVKTLLRLASTLSRPRVRSARPQRPSNFLLIENVNDNITEAFLARTLASIGPVRKVHIPSLEGRRRGIACVQLPTAVNPEVYVSRLQNRPICGMRITVNADEDADKFRTKWNNILRETSRSQSHSMRPVSSISAPQHRAPSRSERIPAPLSRKNVFIEASSSSSSSSSSRLFSSVPPMVTRPSLTPKCSAISTSPSRQLKSEALTNAMKVHSKSRSPSHVTEKDLPNSELIRERLQHKFPEQDGSQLPANNRRPNEVVVSGSQPRQQGQPLRSAKLCWQPALCISSANGDLDGNRLMIEFSAFYPDRAITLDDGSYIVIFKNTIDRDGAFRRGPSECMSSDIRILRVDYCTRRKGHDIRNKGLNESIRTASNDYRADIPAGGVQRFGENGNIDTRNAPSWDLSDRPLSVPTQVHPENGRMNEVTVQSEIVDRGSHYERPKPVYVGNRGIELIEMVKSSHEQPGGNIDLVSELLDKRIGALVVDQASSYITVQREHQLQSIVNQKVLHFVEQEGSDKRGKGDATKTDVFVGTTWNQEAQDKPLSSTHCSLDEYLRSGSVPSTAESGSRTKSSHVVRSSSIDGGFGSDLDDLDTTQETRHRGSRSMCRVLSGSAHSLNEVVRDATDSGNLTDERKLANAPVVPGSGKSKTRFSDAPLLSTSLLKQDAVCNRAELLYTGPLGRGLKSASRVNSDGSLCHEYVKGRVEDIDRSVSSLDSLAHVKYTKLRSIDKRKRPRSEEPLPNAGGPVVSRTFNPLKRIKGTTTCDETTDEVMGMSSCGREVSFVESQKFGEEKSLVLVAGGEKVNSGSDAAGIGSDSARTAGYLRKDWQTNLRRTKTHHPGKSRLPYSSRESRQQSRSFRKQLSLINPKHDLFTANGLKQRKKPLQYRKSVIHGMGLFSMGSIEAGEFIAEYIGEVVRNSVADMRQEKYTRRGMGDSYLFRLSNGTVVDATHRGCIARFINHSCDPNVVAKIISVDGEDKIVFYSKKIVREDDELTYDYKFDYEADSQKIPCLCGAWNCRKFLN